MPSKKQPESVGSSETLTIPELEQSKTAVLNTLASQHSRRSYEYAIERIIAWYCSEPRLCRIAILQCSRNCTNPADRLSCDVIHAA
jgi:hypothetical protein